MHIRNIRVSNLKGATTSIAVSQKTLITGPNGSGKTSLIDAAAIGILGYAPWIGKRAGDTMKLSSAPAMTVDLEFDGCDDLRGVSRSFTATDTGGSMKTTTFPVVGTGKKEKEIDAHIVKHLGCAVETISISDFLAMSEDKRREYLFCLIPADDDVADPAEALAKKIIGAGHTEDALASVYALLNEFDQTIGDIARNSTIVFVGALQGWLADAAKKAREEEKRAVLGAKKLTEIKNQEDAVTRPIAQIREESKAAHEEIARLTGRLAEERAAVKAYQGRQKRIEALQSRALRIGGDLDRIAQDAEKMALQREKTSALIDRIAPIETERKALLSELHELQAAISALPQDNTCPLLLEECDRAGVLVTRRAEHVDAAAAIETKEKELREAIAAAIKEAFPEGATLSIEDIAAEYRRLDAELKRVPEATARCVQDSAEIKAELAELAAEATQEPNVSDPDIIEKQIAANRELIKDNEISIKQLEQRDRDRILAEQCRADADKWSARLAAIKSLQSAVGPSGMLGDVLDRARDTVFGRANRLISGALGSCSLGFDKHSNALGLDFGAGKFVAMGTLSGGEAIIVAAAIRVSIMHALKTPFKILLIDNIEALDLVPGRRNQLAAFCSEALGAGEIDQVILAGVEPPANAADLGYLHIEMYQDPEIGSGDSIA